MSLPAALSGARVLLGDQSPWAGGLLRWHAVARAFDGEVCYAVQDVDPPWVQKGQADLHIVRDWTDYHSLACRYPWTFSVPGATLPNLLDSFQSPRGMHYLVGPATDETLCAHRSGAPRSYHALLNRMLTDEHAWATRLAEMVELVARPSEATPPEDVYGLTRFLADRMGLGAFSSFVELFRSGRLRATDLFPEECYWYVTEDGRRCARPVPGACKFPRGTILPLEIAANGWVLGCTRFAYLDRIRELRDRHAPGLALKLLSISFDWRFDGVDPVDAQLRIYNGRKRRRGQAEFAPAPAAAEAIRAYWRRRPTPLSWLVLGGDLRPAFELVEL